MKTVSFVFGTRPEAIKLAPIILALRSHPALKAHVCVTAQHRQMLDQILDVFGITPDADLDLMQPNQTLASLTSRAIAAIDEYLNEHKPDIVLVQGDTTTVLSAALAAFYRSIPVGHIEAGLRTWNKKSPFPEEINRVLATRLADLHFAPTESSRQNLLREGVPSSAIYVTGNTVVDALLHALKCVKDDPPTVPGLPVELFNKASRRPMVLVTAHRRESFGAGFEAICAAIVSLARRFVDVAFVYPVHPNPRVRETVVTLLTGLSNVYLIEPLGYLPFVALMNRARLILTDSGGVQEEACTLKKPVLLMRETTERPEGVETGLVRLVGTTVATIVERTGSLLSGTEESEDMSKVPSPYGDGSASRRIIGVLETSPILAGRG